jgi:hypothetical protein
LHTKDLNPIFEFLKVYSNWLVHFA